MRPRAAVERICADRTFSDIFAPRPPKVTPGTVALFCAADAGSLGRVALFCASRSTYELSERGPSAPPIFYRCAAPARAQRRNMFRRTLAWPTVARGGVTGCRVAGVAPAVHQKRNVRRGFHRPLVLADAEKLRWLRKPDALSLSVDSRGGHRTRHEGSRHGHGGSIEGSGGGEAWVQVQLTEPTAAAVVGPVALAMRRRRNGRRWRELVL
jgi:hypothetical protein